MLVNYEKTAKVRLEYNRLQQGARTEDTNRLDPLADKWRAFGWEAIEIDGHDYDALYEAFTSPRDGRPRCVIANTIKGRGVSFMENVAKWHHGVPSEAELKQALAELDAAEEKLKAVRS